MRLTALIGIVVLSLSLVATRAASQTPDTTSANDPPRVFLDCQNTYCDFDFLRTEIAFVEWVRDRKAAQIHLLVTSQRTGSGGREYTLNFVGQERFAGADQILKYVSLPVESSDDVRNGLARVLALGLARYAAATDVANRLKITYNPPAGSDTAKRITRDPWNYWVYRTHVNANLNGESRSYDRRYRARVSAQRTTAAWKLELSSSGSYSEQQYIFANVDYDSAGGYAPTTFDTTRAYSHNYDAFALVVKSMGEHWSSGAAVWASSSSYGNEKLTLQMGPALEYNIFPYSQSTRRQFTLRYGIRANRLLYNEETIYLLREENRWDHTLEGEFETNQKWGQAEVELRARQYFFDPSKRSLSINAYTNYRVFKGFSVDFFGGYEVVGDQLSLEREGASSSEVLLRLREQQTDYRFYTGVGISYTFGSIYNSVVNPRFP